MCFYFLINVKFSRQTKWCKYCLLTVEWKKIGAMIQWKAENNDLYTEYADVFSFLFRLSTVKLFGFSLLEMYA